MSKLIIFTIVLIIGYFYYNSVSEPSSTTSQEVSMSQTEDTTTSETSNTADVMRYRTDHAAELSEAQSPRRVLFFYASWCPTCIPADKILSSNQANLPSDLIVYRLNYNDPDTDQVEKDLAKQYGVTYQHTFVQIDESGEVVTKWNGGGLSELLANLK